MRAVEEESVARAEMTARVRSAVRFEPGTSRDLDSYHVLGIPLEVAERASALGGSPGSVPYVPRTQDATLDRLLDSVADSHETALILVRGASTAGKSRTLFEALRRSRHADAPLICPKSAADWPDILGSFAGLSIERGPICVWIDDIEDYVASRPSGHRLIDDVRGWPQPVVLLATTGGRGWRRLSSDTNVVRARSRVEEECEYDPNRLVDIDSRPQDDGERNALASLVSDDSLREVILREGIGQFPALESDCGGGWLVTNRSTAWARR